MKNGFHRIILFVCLLLSSISLYAQQWESIILAGDTWQYLPAQSEPPADWNMPGFDDTPWEEGPGGIGYADGDDATVIGTVNSLYLRKTFQVQTLSEVEALLLDIDYDDAFVAYLNGIEIARSFNITVPDPAFNSSLTTYREALMYQGGMPERYKASSSLLEQGENLLAVHILNNGTSSSDLSSLVYLHGLIHSADQVFRDPPAWFREPFRIIDSKLPIVMIDTKGSDIPDEPKIVAHMGIINNGPGNTNNQGDPFTDYNGRIMIEQRGQSSQMFPKRSWAFETQDSLGMNLNISLLGMPDENDWILYAPYSDKSMLRNVITFSIGRRLDNYCSPTAYCEVFLNGQYMGVYVLMEKIKIDNDRVDIELPVDGGGSDEMTGGYIFRVDKTDDGFVYGYTGFTSYPDPSYPMAMDITYQYYDPKPHEMTTDQKQYLKGCIQETEAALIAEVFNDPDVGYNRYLNTGSFVDIMLLYEVSKEVDKYRYSNYFYKRRSSEGGEIFAGPPWDFNLGYGNVDYWPEGLVASNWLYDDLQPYEWSLMFWWARLMEDPWFFNLASTRWRQLRSGALSDANLAHMIDSVTALIDEAQQRNYEKWPVLGQYIWPNHDWQGNTYADEVEYFSNWLFDRLDWMDLALNGRQLEPDAKLIPLEGDGQTFTYRVLLEDDYLDHDKLTSDHVRLVTADPRLIIQSIRHESASSFTVTVRGVGFVDVSDVSFGLLIDDQILNGFYPLSTATVVTGQDKIQKELLDINVYTAGEQMFIKTCMPCVLPESMLVYNTLGQLAGSFDLERSRLNVINTGLAPGIYVVRLCAGGRHYAEKVVIR